MKRPFISALASSRISRYGEIAAVITGTPLRDSRSATKAIRRMLVSRSSFENPRPFERFSRTMSPSSTSSLDPRARSSFTSRFVIVVLPEPESPVNQRQNPFCSAIRGRLLSIRVDQDLSDLVPAELVRRLFASREHLPHLRTRQDEARLVVVRARLVRRHPLAGTAPEGVLEEQRLDPQLGDVDVIEDPLRVVGAVVVA